MSDEPMEPAELLQGRGTAELAALARAAIEQLAHSPDPAAFSQLLALSQVTGESLGVSARTLAEHSSWAGVADIAGISRQGAWSRWAES